MNRANYVFRHHICDQINERGFGQLFFILSTTMGKIHFEIFFRIFLFGSSEQQNVHPLRQPKWNWIKVTKIQLQQTDEHSSFAPSKRIGFGVFIGVVLVKVWNLNWVWVKIKAPVDRPTWISTSNGLMRTSLLINFDKKYYFLQSRIFFHNLW